jgi:DNA sulfur modification protein DndB
MGDWVYYVTFLRMRDIAQRVSIADDIHKSASLRDLLQRRLTDRSRGITDYLLKQKQRFFNALVVATYGGAPQWNELAVREPPVPFNAPLEIIEGTLGILTLSGTEKLFAVDGQHRVAGIKEAVQQRKSIQDEEVCVIFVPGVTQQHRDEDSAGFERTRRLFTTLNRYAKPVSKKDIIALDEDDVVAILTRTLVEDYPLFREKISPRSGNSIPPSDRASFTTITALYDALNIFLSTGRGWTEFKKLRPPDKEVRAYLDRAVGLWDALIEHNPPLRQMSDSSPDQQVAASFRGEHGGHLLFRPVGLLLAVRVTKRLTDAGRRLRDAVRRISSVPIDLADKPWVGLLWDPTNRRMITAPENQRAAERLLVYLTRGDLARLKSSPGRLRHELAGLLKIPPGEYTLPPRPAPH